MQQDAELHAEEDKARREFVDFSNEAERHLGQAEKLRESEHLDADDKEELANKANDVRSAMSKKDDLSGLKSAVETLQQTVLKYGDKSYKAGAAAGAGSSETKTEEENKEKKD